MARKYIDCREHSPGPHCSLALVADSEDELVEAAVQHLVSVHGQQDSFELRNMLRQTIREGIPPEYIKAA
jgi:predicted small metal-binding protein